MRRLPLPAQLVEQAREYAEGKRQPVEPRDAATVVLLRAASVGLSVYLLRRQRSMAFAGGMCVFPGGGVDKRDFDHTVAWAGPSVGEWAERLRTDEPTARALVCAAVRETFEESGVLLAGASPDEVVDDTTGADWEADRDALEKRDLSLTEFLTRRGLVVRTDLLGVWSGWTTPVFEPRRFRAWFFVAVLPEGQRTRDVSGESDAVAWRRIGDALADVDAGRIAMMPPTYLTCLDVDRYASPAGVLAEAATRTVDMFTPEVTGTGDQARLTTPPGLSDLLPDEATGP